MAGHPLRPATRHSLGRPLPHQQADRPRAHPPPQPPKRHFPPATMQQPVISGISHPFRQLSRSEGQITHVLLTRSPLEYPPKGAFPLDLHVLSTPPAFVLSQDQTLHRNQSTEKILTKQRSTSKQSPESLFVNSKKPPTQPPQPPHTNARKSQNNQADEVQHTNQFIDKHTVEFSKTRRARERPHVRRLGGNLRKLTGPRPRASNRIRLVPMPASTPLTG